jgi:hypothetical protein
VERGSQRATANRWAAERQETLLKGRKKEAAGGGIDRWRLKAQIDSWEVLLALDLGGGRWALTHFALSAGSQRPLF